MTRALLIASLALAACGGETVDTAGLPSTDNYTDWHLVEVSGPAPGHGDTFRRIFANDVAHDYSHAGPYPEGSVLVKEIRDGSFDGAISYVAIMRKIDEDDPIADGLSIDGDWLFTMADEVGAQETYYDFCYAKCHVQGPIDAAWYDYGR